MTKKEEPSSELYEDTIDDIFRLPGSSQNNGPATSSCSPNRPESEYFQELAELVQETLLPSLQGSDKKQLRDMLRQLKEKKSGAVQEEDVSTSGPAVLASHIGPMVLEALDGFLFVLNADGMVEYASENVSKYLSFTQGDMMNRQICNFVMPGDHDFFSQLLPDSVGWMLHYPGPKERRSQSFSCRFLVKPGVQKKDPSSDSGMSLGSAGNERFTSLHVSAISLPYPTDVHRDDDDLFNTLAAPPEAGACLVCVARRVQTDIKSPPPVNPDVSRQFVLTVSLANGTIRNIEHRDFTVEPLFPKSLVGVQLESLCSADLPVVRTLLDHYSTECSSQIRFLIRGEQATTVLTVQARSRPMKPDSKLVQIECMVTRVDSAPNPNQFDNSESNRYLNSTNQSGPGPGGSFSLSQPHPDSLQQSQSKGQSTKENPMSPTVFHSPPNLAGLSPQQRGQLISQQQQQQQQLQQMANEQNFQVNQMPKYSPGQPMLHPAGEQWNQVPNPMGSPAQIQMPPKNPPSRQLSAASKMSHLSIAGQPQQFENLSPLPVEATQGSEVTAERNSAGQPDTLQQLCSSIFDETPPPSAASAPASSLMSPVQTDPGMVSPYSRAQSAFPDTPHMEGGLPHHMQQQPPQMPPQGYYPQQGPMFAQQGYPPGIGNPQSHHYHLFHPYSYPGERGNPAVLPNTPDPLAPAPGPPPKGKGRKQRSKSGGGNGTTPKPKAPKGTGAGRKKKTPASKASPTSSTTVTTAPFMSRSQTIDDPTMVPCSMGNPPISSVMEHPALSATSMFSQDRTDEQNTILKSLLQPEQLGLSSGSPGGPGHQLLHQLLNEEEQSPPLVSSSTSCQVASSEVSSTAYHPYPHGSTPATPSPSSSGTAGTPGSAGKRRQSLTCDGPIPAKQQSSPSVGSTTTTPGSVLVQLLQNNTSHTPTLPTSIATSPLDKLAKENKEKQLDNGHRISTTVAEQLNRSRNNPATKGHPAQQNPGSTPVSAAASVHSTAQGSPVPGGMPQMMDRFGSPTHPSQPMEGLPYGTPMQYRPYYEGGVPPGYGFANGQHMAMRGQMIQARRVPHPGMPLQHPSEQVYPYGPKGPLPGMYGLVSGIRPPMSAPPFMHAQPGYPGNIPGSASMMHPGTPYGMRGPATSTVFSFEEVVPYAQSPRLMSPCAQATPRPQMLPEVAQREAMTAGLARQVSMAERQISYEMAPGRPGGQMIDANVAKPPAYPGTIVTTSQSGQFTTTEISDAGGVGNDGAPANGNTQQTTGTMEPSFFDGLVGGFDLDDESTRNMVFQYLQ